MLAKALPPLVAASLALQGCATIHREPFTEAQQVDATIPGIPAARFWADAPDAARQMSPSFAGAQGEKTMLALSGGTDNGAYGAGLLNGWTQAGTRPEFTIVTGVSTGALIAPFAFLGADQDATLERLFTTISAKDIYRGRFALAIPASPSAASTEPLARLITSVMTDSLIDRIGREHVRGRRLFVGTANLDAQRMVIWNMGRDRGERCAGALFAVPAGAAGLLGNPGVLPAGDDTVAIRRQGHQRVARGWRHHRADTQPARRSHYRGSPAPGPGHCTCT